MAEGPEEVPVPDRIRQTPESRNGRWKSLPAGMAFLAAWALLAPGPAPGAPRVDGDEAHRWVVRQCDLGPRVPGTPAHSAWIEMVRGYLDSLGVEYQLQRFPHPDPHGGGTLTGTNILARFRPEARPRVLFGAHYDSRAWCDEEDSTIAATHAVPGANDGASGSALLLVLARALRENPPPLGVDLAFFDAEDQGDHGSEDTWCLGSAYAAANWPWDYPDWVIVLDMIGSPHTEFGRELYSKMYASSLQDLVFQVAAEKGFREWNPQAEYPVMDDHVPFLRMGIPSIVVIGFNDPFWHTRRDEPANVSPERLSRVGEVVSTLIYEGRLAP